MSRHEEARTFLTDWDPDDSVLPDWVADELDDHDDLQALFNARFAPWDASELGGDPVSVEEPTAAPRRRVGGWLAFGSLAAAALGVLGLGAGYGLVTSYQAEIVEAQRPGDPNDPVLQPLAMRGRDGTLTIVEGSAEGQGQHRASKTKRRTVNRNGLLQLGYIEDGGANAERWPDGTESQLDALGYVSTTPISGRAVDGHLLRGDRIAGETRSKGEGKVAFQYGRYAEAGQQPPRVQIEASRIEIRDRVHFYETTVEPTEPADDLLDAVAGVMLDNPTLGPVVIEGHAEATGKADEDYRVSEDRAKNVRSLLIARGVEADRLQLQAHGSTRPLATPGTDRGQELNGRVDFRIAEVVTPPALPEESPGTEDYTDYGHHSFQMVSDDPLSTFSVDVDTASYSLSRRKLREGYLPPEAAVRVEEFVNFLPYTYRPPLDTDAPFSVEFEATPNPFNAATHWVRVGVQGKKVAVDQRQPVHLTFLVDTSCSMQSDDKLGLAKTTLKMLTEELRDGDTVALVAYAGSAGVILEPTPMSRKDDVIRALDRLTAGGSTAMGAGLSLAYELALQRSHDGATNRVIVLSDGDANVGQTNTDVLIEEIAGYAARGVTLTTAGFGQGNYKDTMMERLANEGDGNYWYIDSVDEARRVFVDKLTSTLVVIAKDVKLQVEWNPESVVAYRLVGYENRDIADVDFRNDTVDAGEIGAGHQVTALYEVALKPGATGRLATMHVRNKAPGPEAPAVERHFDLYESSVRPSFDEAGSDLRMAVAAASFAELLRGNPHLHGASYRDVARIARQAQRVEYDEDRELIELIERAASLSGE